MFLHAQAGPESSGVRSSERIFRITQRYLSFLSAVINDGMGQTDERGSAAWFGSGHPPLLFVYCINRMEFARYPICLGSSGSSVPPILSCLHLLCSNEGWAGKYEVVVSSSI